MKTAQRKQNAASDASTKKSRNAITSYTKVGTCTMKTAKQKQKTVDFQGFSSTDAVGKVSACASSLLKPLQHGSPGLDTCIVNKTKDMPELGSGQSLNYSSKLKLQLFPIDDVTRQGLEKDNHNPYLELTLSSRKKISSVVKHLNIKWGNSRTASGELVLFPYDVELKNLVCNVRWTMKETNTSAADVYSAIGSPEIFRLKYGWILNADQNSFKMPLTALCSEDNLRSTDYQKECCDTKVTAENKHQSRWTSQMPQPLSSDLLITVMNKSTINKDNQKMSHQTSLSWIDNLTNMSFSDLLLEASKNSDTAGGNPLTVERNSYPSQFPFSCDSFDAAIAAHIASNQASTLPTYVPHSSILDVEETCHAFPVPKLSSSSKETTLPTDAKVQTQDPSCQSTAHLQPHSQEQLNHVHDLCNEESTKNLQLDTQGLPNDASSLGLTGISWSDSMGTLEFGVSFSRPYISSDSINISNLIASSLDAFQNCSFFGRDNTIESK